MHRSVDMEFQGCKLGDQRLTERVMKLAEIIRGNPQESINSACGSFAQSKAAYRFFQNEKITSEKLLEPHIRQTLQRASESKSPIIIVQDTASLTYKYPSIKNLGNKLHRKGFIESIKGIELHSSLAVTLSGTPLGILKQTFFTYDEIRDNRGQWETNIQGSQKIYPIEKKTSFRWINHFLSTDMLAKEADIAAIHVSDREGDIYEFLQNAQDSKARYVVRSSINRRTHEGNQKYETTTIEKKLATAPVLGTIEVQKKLSTGSINMVICNIKSIKVLLRKPQRSPSAKSQPLHNILINVVEVKGTNKDAKETIHWRLLTNLDCHNYIQSLKIVDIYKVRWSIECFHRVLKSGFRVEKARLGERKRLEKLVILLSVVSWHLFWIYMMSREYPKLSASILLDPEEIKILKISARKLKVTIPKVLNIKIAVLIIARLGGFLARKQDGPPGMETIWRGWKKFYERIEFMGELTYG